MSPTERPLEGATYDHVALSVADLDTMVAFYGCMGFEEIDRVDFAPAPVRLAVLRTAGALKLELTSRDGSSGEPPTDAVGAALRRGVFHFALRVDDLVATVEAAVAGGARMVSAPRTNARSTGDYAYIADPEGNLIELVADARIGPGVPGSATRGEWAGRDLMLGMDVSGASERPAANLA